MGKTVKKNFSAINDISFLSGGGEMGELMRSKNWSETLIGETKYWPQSLKTSLSILLHSKFPKFLFWGPDHVCFYNDAYRPSLGKEGKHPNILGSRGEDYWVEIWDIIKPLIDQVLGGGEATWSEDQLIPIYRNGSVENVYWTFSYSPVFDESGSVAGVWVTCMETTQKVMTLNALEDSKNQLHFAIESANLATWDYHPELKTFRGNERLRNWYNLKKTEITPLEALDVIADKDQNRVKEAVKNAMDYEKGGMFDITYQLNPVKVKKERIVRAIGKVWFNADKSLSRFNGIVQDITEQFNATKENQMLSTIVDKSNEFIGLAGLDSRVKYINPAGMKMLGWKNIKDRKIEDCIYPEDLSKALSLTAKLFEQDQVSDEFRLLNEQSGEPFWIKWNGLAIRDEKTNQLIALATTSPNITEQKKSELRIHEGISKLEESEKRFRKVADSSPVLIKMTDSEAKITFVNKMWLDFTGHPLKRYLGLDTLMEIHPDDMQITRSQYDKVFESHKEYRAEYRIRAHDGAFRWISNIGVPRFTEDGKFEGYIHACMDIHDMKTQEHQKDLFIGMASHELKTPVTSIKGYTQVLKRKYGDSGDKLLISSLDIVDKQIRVLTKLISDLLDLSKMKTGGLDFTKETFNLNELLTEVIRESEFVNPSHRIEYKNIQSINVYADKERIRQVAVNLLNNAVKYSPQSKKIEVKSIFNDKTASVFIEDFGIGINKENQENIFNRFFREEGKNEETFPGFGIGLYISADIIKRHDGVISVKSEKGKGSIFHFTIPIQKPN
ncbi:sensor histidine kinase [Ulvibacter antarcticus]|uniref:histidine kinase n=1 Tax=Ulvibacter antarcticus TaxID=442714 RepID=A0A3L9Z0L3_9FLAO|nr:PAS domain S-box protein [Ulvibacter antarcticus]RMA66393.1 PAS domain S-box-containing protein [Ulvibacter antarcticus]